eukprot:264251_1
MASKRNLPRRSGNQNEKAKMTAEEFQRLIGQHKHIEHQALRQEVANEFKKYTQNKTLGTIQTNNFLNPKQPPALPVETNRNQTFQRASPWPSYSPIQKAALMLFDQDARYREEQILQYLRSELPQEKIQIAQEVCGLMEQSFKYWRKVGHMARKERKTYEARYNTRTRRYSLHNAPWALQIAMTLLDFHVDHIVDIVYHKPIWSRDHDQYEMEQYAQKQHRQQIKRPQINTFFMNNNKKNENHNFDSDDTTSGEYETYECEVEEEAYVNSEDAPIASPPRNQVADHMTVQELDAIKNKVKIMNAQPLEDLFSNMFNDVAFDGKKIAFANDFEVDLSESDQRNENEEEKAEFVMDNKSNDQDSLNRLCAKYPAMDKDEIRQVFMEHNKNYDMTVFQLDCDAFGDN